MEIVKKEGSNVHYIKVDFTKVKVESVSGEKEEVDMSKGIGNTIYQQTKELEEVELARDIFRNGTAEVNRKQREVILKYYSESPYFIQQALKDAMDFKEVPED